MGQRYNQIPQGQIVLPPMQEDIDKQVEIQTKINIAQLKAKEEIIKFALENTKMYELDAKLAKTKLDIFVAEGFSRPEAMQLITGKP